MFQIHSSCQETLLVLTKFGVVPVFSSWVAYSSALMMKTARYNSVYIELSIIYIDLGIDELSYIS